MNRPAGATIALPSVLWLATGNAGKLREFRAVMGPRGVRVLGLADFPAEFPGQPPPPETIEDGETFAANALKKAQGLAERLGAMVIADDSGLEVDALGGGPGVMSARYAEERFAEQPDHDRANRDKLLEALTDVPSPQRSARFVCALAVCVAGQEAQLFEAEWHGAIATSCRGVGGFGYDPIFLVAGDPDQRTSAQLASAEKNRLSHRAQVIAQLLERLVQPA